MPSRLSATALAGLASLAVGLAAGQADAQTKPAAPVAALAGKPAGLPISGPQPDWVKLCTTNPKTNKQFCQTYRDLRADNGQTLASVAIREEKGAGKRQMVIALPTGMLLQPGVRLVVDQGTAVPGKYSVCMPNVCYAELEAPDSVIASMKKGTTLTVQVLTYEGKSLPMPLQLAGFGKAYDGPATDPKAFQSDQKKLQEQLEQKAKDALKNLDQQSGQ